MLFPHLQQSSLSSRNSLMKYVADPKFISSTAKCCKSSSRPSTTFVPITNVKYCHNISPTHHLNPPIHQDAKPEDALVVAMETQNKRGNRFPFPRNAGNWSRPRRIFPLHPNRVPKEEEEERMRVAVVNHDSTSETKISTNQSARSRRYAMGVVEKRRTSPPSCEDRK